MPTSLPISKANQDIRNAWKARRVFSKAVKKLEKLQAKEDFQLLFKRALYEILPEGHEFAGMLVIQAITKIYSEIALGVRPASNMQMMALHRLLNQYMGRGEVALEQRDSAEAGAPKVLYIGGKQQPPTVTAAVVVPELTDGGEDVSGNSEPSEGE